MISFHQLPTLNASLNLITFCLLISGFLFIRTNHVRAHKICMGSAVACSLLFLVSYLTYHWTAGATRFQGVGSIRTLYFTILISHTILAAIILPLVIGTIYHALRGQFEKHKRIARWTLPIWLYVSLTGVVIYLMLYHAF